MSDVLDSLRPRAAGKAWLDHALITTTGKVLNDAADEIERLRAVVAALTKGRPE